jgi:hypothetical protein
MLSAYADGQLSEKDRNRVAHHLEVCDLCRKEFAAIQLLGRLLCAGEELTPSLGFAAGFWRKVDDMEKIKAGGSWFRWRDWGFGPAWAAAAATIVLVFGVLLYRQTPYRSLENVGETPGLLIAEDIELYEDFEIIQHLDLLEQWKTLSSMEDI